jgi:hypothetical protein
MQLGVSGRFLLGPRASRPQRAEGAKLLQPFQNLSRFALIAGGTPAVPVNAMSVDS